MAKKLLHLVLELEVHVEEFSVHASEAASDEIGTIARFDHSRPSHALAQIHLDVQHDVRSVAQRRTSFHSQRSCVCDVRS